MRIAIRFAAAAILWCAATFGALAQTTPNWPQGFVPTAGQWNALWASKQDYLNAPPLLTTGGVMTGKLVTAASNVTQTGFNVPPGTAPGTPVNGDIWVTASNIFAYINGATVPLGTFGQLSPTRAGDVAYWNGSAWTTLAGNNSGSNCFGEGPSGTPAWVACSGGSGTPGGSNTQVQWNNSSSFGGISGVTSNGTSVTIASGDLILSGSISGSTTLNAPATGGGTLTLPAGSTTLAGLSTSQTFSGTDTFSGTINASGTFQYGGNAMTFPAAPATLLFQSGGYTDGHCLQASGSAGGVSDAGAACGTLNNTNPTQQAFLSGSGTYTTPANVKWIKVHLKGAGGGGGGSSGAGGNGNNTTFGTSLLTAGGGGGGPSNGGVAGANAAGGTNTIAAGPLILRNEAGAPAYGGSLNALPSSPGGGKGGGAGVGNGSGTVNGVAGAANSGGGGSGTATASASAGGGGEGGEIEAIIDSPLSTYAYSVGAGGTGGTGNGGTGGSGYIYVEEHYNP